MLMIRNKSGLSLIELLIAMAVVAIVAVIAAPQISRFKSSYNVRSCATGLIQYMRAARAMAIKENRPYLIVFQAAGTPSDTINPQGRYLIGHDSNGDDDLLDANLDTFGVCKDTVTPVDRLPDTDTDANGDSVPDCVRVVNLNDCGNSIIFGYAEGTTPQSIPNDPSIPKTSICDPSGIPVSGIGFSNSTVEFNSNGSNDQAECVYFQQTSRGYSYAVEISTTVGSTNMWRWDGNEDNATETNWTELR